MDKKKKPLYKKWWVWLIAVLIFARIGFLLDGEEETKEEPKKVETSAPKVEKESEAELKEKEDAEIRAEIDKMVEEQLSKNDEKAKEEADKKTPVAQEVKVQTTTVKSKSKIESAVNDSIHNHFGKTSNIDKRKNIIETSFNEETGLLTAVVLGNDNLSTKFIVGGMHKAITGVARDMKNESEVKELMIFVQFPLVDAYGNEKDGDVMRANLTRSTLDKINFENFDYNKVPDIADSYFLHKSLQ